MWIMLSSPCILCKKWCSKLDDGWPESEKDVFQAALRMVVVKDNRWIVGEFYMSYGRIWCEKVRLIKKRILGKGHQMTRVLQPQRERGREREREGKGGRKKTWRNIMWATKMHRRLGTMMLRTTCVISFYYGNSYTHCRKSSAPSSRGCEETRRLYRDAFIQRRFYTQTLLHTDTFTHRRFHTETLLHAQKLLHTDTFTHGHFYTQTLLHTYCFTHRRFYT